MIMYPYDVVGRRSQATKAGACKAPIGGSTPSAASRREQERLGIDEAQAVSLALRFVLSNPNVSCALSGMGSSEMVDQNAATVSEDALSDEERADLVKLVEELEELASLYCTGCNYCAPCPHGVSIARRFELMNQHRVWGATETARSAYRRLLARESEGECQECGECLPKCPQEIEIIEQLKETEAALGSA